MNFSDDPLADLLSDNSFENDSFFENTGARKARNNPTKSKNKLDELFGIKEEESETLFPASKSTPKQVISSTSKPTITPRITTQQPSQTKSNTTADDDDLGFDPLRPKAAGKVNIFDDLLGGVTNKNTEAKRPATAQPIASRREIDKPAVSRQSTDTTTDTSQARPKTSAGRRSSGASGIMNIDPLGLFSGTDREREYEKDHNASTSGMSSPKTRKRGTTADWLGLSAEPEVEANASRQKVKQPQSPLRTTKPSTLASNLTTEPFKEPVETLTQPVGGEHCVAPTTGEQLLETPQPTIGGSAVQNIFQLNTHNLEMKNAYTALHQQESQLVLAVQMKQQEKTMVEMQRKQEALLQQQERQFQGLLQQQLQRQHQMEEHIKMQQNRINTHLQLLMTQPVVLPPLPLSEVPDFEAFGDLNEQVDDEMTLRASTTKDIHRPSHIRNRSQSPSPQETALDMVQMEADIRRFELEKIRLEELVDSLKTNHVHEMELIENSYKKQLQVWEEQSEAIETLLRTELEEQKKHYISKLDMMEHEKQKMKSEMVTEIETLKQDHADEMRKLKKTHEDSLDMLRDEHHRMLENVRQTKMLEFAAVQENSSYLETLKSASSKLENLSGDLHGLRDNMQMKIDLLNKEKEKHLEARERQVEDAERRLKISEDTNEEEKKRLMTLVSNLEQQLSKLSKESAEENWMLRQRMSSLDAEKSVFEREKEFAREQMARDEKRMADLKEQQLAETQRVMLELQEERKRLCVERAKIETERKLHPSNDAENKRMELDAVMQVAQDATRQADAERMRYNKLIRELEQQRRELVDKESMLQIKEEEVRQELISFRTAEQKSLEIQQNARAAEQNYHMKIQYLQQRMHEIGEKEVQLSQERLMLSEERIAVQQYKKELEERRCELCKMGQDRFKIVHLLNDTNGTGMGSSGDYIANGLGTTKAMPSGVEYVAKLNLPQVMPQNDLVDRILDENIAKSYRKMQLTTLGGNCWTEAVLDDDAKELALQNLNGELMHDINALIEGQMKSTYQ